MEQLRATRRTGGYPYRRHLRNDGCGILFGYLGGAVNITVKPFAGLPAQHPARQPLRSDHAGAVAWLFVVLAVDRLHHGMRHIQSGQVHQFEGAELEADLVLEDAIDGCEISDSFTDDAQGLGAISATRMVDDKSGRVLCLYRCVSHQPGVVAQRDTGVRVGFQAGNDFDHFHEWHGVEKVKTRKTPGMF